MQNLERVGDGRRAVNLDLDFIYLFYVKANFLQVHLVQSLFLARRWQMSKNRKSLNMILPQTPSFPQQNKEVRVRKIG